MSSLEPKLIFLAVSSIIMLISLIITLINFYQMECGRYSNNGPIHYFLDGRQLPLNIYFRTPCGTYVLLILAHSLPLLGVLLGLTINAIKAGTLFSFLKGGGGNASAAHAGVESGVNDGSGGAANEEVSFTNQQQFLRSTSATVPSKAPVDARPLTNRARN